MHIPLILVLSLTSIAATPQDNVIILQNTCARLDPNWLILTHIPFGYVSIVSAGLTDEQGKPKNDKSMILFGVCDVSDRDGLTMLHEVKREHRKKNERKAGEWLINYYVERHDDDGYALVIDALKYEEEHKCYLWVRRGRRIENPQYTLQDSDLEDILTFTKRISVIGQGRQTGTSKDD